MMLNSPSYYSEGWDPSTSSTADGQAAKATALARWQATLSNMYQYGHIRSRPSTSRR